MKLDAVELRPCERARLVPDRVRDDRRAEVVDERRAPQRRRLRLGQAQHPGCVRGELRAAAAVAVPVGRLEVDEVGDDDERVVERGTGEEPVRVGLEREHGVPRIRAGEPVEPVGSVREEDVGHRRVVRLVAAFLRGLERALG